MTEPVTFSRHALERMEQMGVSEGEVLSAIEYPVDTYASSRYAGTITYKARRVSVVLGRQYHEDPAPRHVITVLWSDRAAYEVLGRGRITAP